MKSHRSTSAARAVQALILTCAPFLAAVEAAAQSQFSIPNPLIKPATREAAGRPGPAGAGGAGGGGAAMPSPLPSRDTPSLPATRPVERPGQDAAPLPSSASSRAETGPEVVMRALGAYTVTAIVGDAAVLRSNVGVAVENGQGDPAGAVAGQGGGAAAIPAGNALGADPQAARMALKQRVLRIRSGKSFNFGGVMVTPTIVGNQIDFVVGPAGSIMTSAMESLSTPGSTLALASREQLDPATPGRITPPTAPRSNSPQNGFGSTSQPGQTGATSQAGASPTSGFGVR